MQKQQSHPTKLKLDPQTFKGFIQFNSLMKELPSDISSSSSSSVHYYREEEDPNDKENLSCNMPSEKKTKTNSILKDQNEVRSNHTSEPKQSYKKEAPTNRSALQPKSVEQEKFVVSKDAVASNSGSDSYYVEDLGGSPYKQEPKIT